MTSTTPRDSGPAASSTPGDDRGAAASSPLPMPDGDPAPTPDGAPLHVVVMGVSGSGKTTVARLLAQRLRWDFEEADAFHPEANIAKMHAGTPLDDDDRWPWLRAIRDWITEHDRAGRSTVVTCSALKVSYRDVLREAEGNLVLVHLDADPAVIGDRLTARTDHFMPPTLLPSQLATLEPLEPWELGEHGEHGFVVVADAPPAELVGTITDRLHLTKES